MHVILMNDKTKIKSVFAFCNSFLKIDLVIKKISYAVFKGRCSLT